MDKLWALPSKAAVFEGGVTASGCWKKPHIEQNAKEIVIGHQIDAGEAENLVAEIS